MKLNVRLVSPFMLLLVLFIFTGCISTSPVSQVPTVSAPATAITTTVPTYQVIASVTAVPANPVPEETPVPVEAYVKRPFGFTRYEYNPSHKVRLLESHVETDPTGARMVVGTIKNIGSERIDLVTVTVTLSDADGNEIGSVGSEINYLDPNKVWKFRTTPFTMSDFKSHEIAEIFTG